MIVVDSSIWIAHVRGDLLPGVRWLKSTAIPTDILLGDLVLLELLRGARDEQQASRLEQDLRRFPQVQMINSQRAVRAARNYRHLRKLGITPRKAIDVIIATFCIDDGHQLLHNDRDFDHFETHLGLAVFKLA